MSHTPGPWVSKVDTVETADGSVICDVRHAGTHITGDNARLLAAAPDLLAACKAVLPQLRWADIHGSRCTELIALAEAAIAKAEGGSA